jgi:hypothetical protein
VDVGSQLSASRVLCILLSMAHVINLAAATNVSIIFLPPSSLSIACV